MVRTVAWILALASLYANASPQIRTLQQPLMGVQAPPLGANHSQVETMQLTSLGADSFTLLSHPDLPGHRVRIKKTTFCDPTVNAYSGYLDVDQGAKHMFFYFFESRRNPEKDDVMMWINGGPGCSSAMGLLMELGPCSIDMKNASSNGTVWNPHSWNEAANIFFLDQPVGVGFSYADYGETVETTEAAAKNIHAFLRIFFETFSQFSGRPLHLSGESYGGRYLPVFASEIYDQNQIAIKNGQEPLNLQSVLIGNGITDISTLYEGRYEIECGLAALDVPFQSISNCVRMKTALPRCQKAMRKSCIDTFDLIDCGAAINFCDDELSTAMKATGRNVYDVSTMCKGDLCYEENDVIKQYLDRPDIRALLGVESPGNFSACSDPVYEGFVSNLDKWRVPTQYYVAGLLERGLRILIYAGTYDWQCNWVANKLWVDKLEWSGQEEYNKREWREWDVQGKVVGETKSAGKLTFATIRAAGHMISYACPSEAGAHDLNESSMSRVGTLDSRPIPVKIDQADLASPELATRIEDLWFTDAEHVFLAGDKKFRVSGKKLAEKSEVFRDMLEIGKPAESYAGCPVIYLPDTPSEVEYFLRAFFIDRSFAPPPVPTSFAKLLAILRLSHKYEVKHLLQRALQHLATAYPTNLKDWDSRNQMRTFPESLIFDHEFLLLQTALKVKATWAMPALYYSCGRYSMEKILNSPAWICAGDLLFEKNQCLQGYVHQFAATLRVLKFLVTESPRGCISPSLCYKKRLTWFHTVETWKPSIPLEIWNQMDWINYSKDVCTACLEEAKVTHRQARVLVWDTLPQTYGLEGWKDLESKKASDLKVEESAIR